MATYRYVRASGVRKRVKENGKRCGRDFLDALDRHIESVVNRCCVQWNGARKTLDATIINLIIGRR